MKILFLLTQDLESPSGLGRYWPLARELAHLGNTVTIATLHSNYSALTRKRYRREGVDIWYVAPMHVRKQGSLKSYYSPAALAWVIARATLALSWAVVKTPANIVHIGKPHPMNGIAGWLAKYILHRQVWLDCDDDETSVNRFGSAWQRRIMAFFESRLPARVDYVTTHTYFNLSRLSTFGVPSNKIYYLSNGVDRSRFDPAAPAQVETLRHSLGLEGKKVVAYIGSLSLVGHPVDLLLKAFASIREKVPEAVLLLVGGGEDYETLQKEAQRLHIEAACIFRGRVPPDEVSLYYPLADVTVDPVTDNDAARARSPLKLFESWAMGVPFVTADVGDRRLLLSDPPAGLLAAPGDPNSLAGSILTVFEDERLARSICAAGAERVKDFYWDRLALRLNDLYQSHIPVTGRDVTKL